MSTSFGNETIITWIRGYLVLICTIYILTPNSQIMILKKLYPILNEISVRELLEEIRKNGEQWEFAEMGWGQAMDLVNQAAEKGLDIQIEEIEM